MASPILRNLVTLWGVLLPLERIALLSLGFSFAIISAFSVSFYFPDGHSTIFAVEHYVVGMILALLVALLFSERPTDGWALLGLVRNTVSFCFVVFLHFNFKLWAQLVNPYLFDSFYQWLDMFFSPMVDLILFVNLAYLPLKEWLPNAYHDVFVLMFFWSFAVHAITRSGRICLSELITAVALILSLGGAAYMIAPAWGPFVYSPGEGGLSFHIQQAMGSFQERFVASAGSAYNGAEFILPLAAMPSLHIAHAWLLSVYAFRHVRWLGYVYLPLVIFIFTEAVASRWHYVIDLAVGLCLTYLCIHIARRMHMKPP